MRGTELAGHPAADIAQARIDGGVERGQPTAAQGAEAVADLEQFVEVFGDHQDRRAGIAQGNQRAMYGGGGFCATDVDGNSRPATAIPAAMQSERVMTTTS